MNKFGKTLLEYGLTKPVLNWTIQHGIIHRILAVAEEELNYNREREQETYERMRALLNQEQYNCFQVIVAAVCQHEQNPQVNQHSGFFLQGPAGTGKTFLYNCLFSYHRAQGKIVLCVESSGIAAQLLPGGRTAHTIFRFLYLMQPLQDAISQATQLWPS